VNLRLAQRRTLWWPTALGWCCLIALLSGVTVFWCFESEAFLATTQRVNANVLVVEGWIGSEGVQAAETEFESGHYRYVVTTNGLTENHWGDQRWVYAEMAAKELIGDGVPANRIIIAAPLETPSQRTFESAAAVWRMLAARGITPVALNVFTQGPHARRSRLVFAKVFAPGAHVGVVAWMPADYTGSHWWQSSERATDLLKENAGYLFERLFNSGRSSNRPTPALVR
jgi:hypothetical protein